MLLLWKLIKMLNNQIKIYKILINNKNKFNKNNNLKFNWMIYNKDLKYYNDILNFLNYI